MSLHPDRLRAVGPPAGWVSQAGGVFAATRPVLRPGPLMPDWAGQQPTWSILATPGQPAYYFESNS